MFNGLVEGKVDELIEAFGIVEIEDTGTYAGKRRSGWDGSSEGERDGAKEGMQDGLVQEKADGLQFC